MDLIDFRLVFTQILGFLILLWALNKWAFGPLLGIREIAGPDDQVLREREVRPEHHERQHQVREIVEVVRDDHAVQRFSPAEPREARDLEGKRAQALAHEEKRHYEQELRGIDAKARQRLTEAVAEGQKVGAEIRQQAQAEAVRRLERAQDDIARESEKAKERIKQQVIDLALLSAEKILRQKLDDPAQRRLAGEFVDEVEALR